MHEVWAYFKNATVPKARKSLALRAGKELCRGNVSSMDELAAMCESGPEKLLSIRNIGEKSVTVILEVCAMYNEENKREERK